MDDRANILLVDDQPRNLDALEAILESPECRLVRAQSADEALLALLRSEFAAIVLDIMMPGVSGLELAAIIKGRKRTQDIPILFLTAQALEESEVLRGYGVGAVDYLQKPINPEILRSKVAAFVDLYRKTRALAAANRALAAEVAERQRVQDELRHANEELEARVRDRTANLTRANRALRESEQRLRVAVEVSRTIVLEIDMAEEVVVGGGDLADLLGLPAGDVSLSLADFQAMFHPDDRDKVLRAVESCLDPAGDRRFAMDHRILRADGGLRWVGVRAQALGGETGNGHESPRIIAAMLDITDRKLDEERLRDHNRYLDAAVAERTEALVASQKRLAQQERLAAIGTLAAGLGHDMSNLLLPIRARLESLAADNLSNDGATDVSAIREAAGYLQRLASGLRLLSIDPDRAGESESSTDLGAWWSEVEGIFRSATPRGVVLRGGCAADLPPVAISAVRLTQIVFNLVQNAGEAMGERAAGNYGNAEASITVSASLEKGGEGTGAGPAVALTISDNGPGMTEEVAARCFDPYFSTKVRAVSTGMGLPMARAWVQKAGGSIRLETAPGRGTTFVIVLPSAERAGNPPESPTGPSRPRIAISLTDTRIAAFASAIVTECGAVPGFWDGEGVPDADVWIVSGASALPARTAAFVGQGIRRHAVVLAERPGQGGRHPGAAQAAQGSGMSGQGAERVWYVGREPSIAVIRQAIHGLMRSTGGMPLPEAAEAGSQSS